jgi:ATP-dependent DNA helicase Q1
VRSAGRDGERAVCVVYYRAADVSRQAAMSHRDRAGPRGIYEMARYCHAASCRRRHIAMHLGDSDPGPCPPSGPATPQCDRCAARGPAVAGGETGGLDLSGAARTVMEAAEKAGGSATMARLADMCRSGASGLEKGWGRAEWEGLVVHMLGAGLLALRFRQTRFATNAYVVPAAAAAAVALRGGQGRLVADIRLRV